MSDSESKPTGNASLKPGVYVAARDLAGAAIVGTHQFVILVPANQSLKDSVDLGDGTMGVVLGAHNDHGKLTLKYAEPSDLMAVRQHVNPKVYSNKLTPGFSPEVKPVDLGKSNVDDAIIGVLASARSYSMVTVAKPISYPSIAGQFKAGCINSNSWAQSLIDHSVGKSKVSEDFVGADNCHENRLDGSYFGKPTPAAAKSHGSSGSW